jgi:hypothetical protein
MGIAAAGIPTESATRSGNRAGDQSDSHRLTVSAGLRSGWNRDMPTGGYIAALGH